jgi:hypothetical protein
VCQRGTACCCTAAGIVDTEQRTTETSSGWGCLKLQMSTTNSNKSQFLEDSPNVPFYQWQCIIKKKASTADLLWCLACSFQADTDTGKATHSCYSSPHGRYNHICKTRMRCFSKIGTPFLMYDQQHGIDNHVQMPNLHEKYINNFNRLNTTVKHKKSDTH